MMLGARFVVVGVAAKKELITDNASQTSYLIWVVMINLQSWTDVDIG